ncbi:MAG: hypothetical protein AAGM46_23990 [Cyanobacteria bacterium J06582_2]
MIALTLLPTPNIQRYLNTKKAIALDKSLRAIAKFLEDVYLEQVDLNVVVNYICRNRCEYRL